MIALRAKVNRVLGDMLTPVSTYLRLRERFPRSILLESADYQPNQNCFTYICLCPIAGFTAECGEVAVALPPGRRTRWKPDGRGGVLGALHEFVSGFAVECDPRFRFIANGLFGYMAYDALEHFEDLRLSAERQAASAIPEICYNVYRFVIAINHYKHKMFVLENELADGASLGEVSAEEIEYVMQRGDIPAFGFARTGEERSNFDDAAMTAVMARCKGHIFRGDVFQIVPSRRFAQPFRGDEFAVYRALRTINPSPYLFFFDCGGYKIFGSSPEAELVIEGRKASLYPIAGTCRRSGDEAEDAKLIEALCADPKENAEHVMLVDLARNDLSKHCEKVYVERFREVHQYSHVIHLVSKVSGEMYPHTGTVQLLADTFPAGTLSGAPKYRAMELIDRYERGRRGFYGGAIGYIGFSGNCNHAIMIRSFLSRNGVLFSQAGAGVVADSVPENEVQEVNNKLKALNAALVMAEEMQLA